MDIVQRLREEASGWKIEGDNGEVIHGIDKILLEAADEIERLRQFEPAPHPDGHDLP